MFAHSKSAIIISLFSLASAACSDSTTSSSRQPLSLSISTKSTAPAAASTLSPDITVTSGTNTLVITSAQVVMSEIELKGTSTATCTSTETEECSELKLDPLLVNLPLNALMQLDLGALVPAGTYRELSFKIDAVQSGDQSGSAFLTAHPDFAGVSVRVQGTFNGQPFTFTSNQDVGFEMEFSQPVTVGGTSATNLTIAIDVGAWFKDASGNVLSPSSSANQSQINNNIQRSFHAFEDDNHDGVEDHS